MNKYKLSNLAKEDLIRIHHYGIKKFVETQADKYFESFFKYFDIIAQRPFSFEAVDYIKIGYRPCVCGSDSIYYKVNNDIIEIMAIVGRQDLNNIISV
ncbi:MAG: type II toxin-antitoxin system RelE/ParE family toxin [Bacteroidales bacterium]|nr:type II toxin-antitoxin system RelE/ParE family toxin [Bacteroidales bacterium]